LCITEQLLAEYRYVLAGKLGFDPVKVQWFFDFAERVDAVVPTVVINPLTPSTTES